MRFSPRLHEFLLRRAWAHDDEHLAMAEIWRRVRHDAEQLGLYAPGYHTIRTVVRAERERRAAQREALVIAVEEAFQWSPDLLRILDHLAAAARLHRFSWPLSSTTASSSHLGPLGDWRPP
jgi:hypothetical protein